eukprot:gnl/Chilomastix_cuspidata/6012.p2 GENE.gnl/Chilomastix_cuspidata/6012~~gnl/Chilomastix_cuspidata/6012.p2  ORF type:complete len:225 (+),score=101.57 gnl/Chilomastix_cuspidata/6012:32-706(+)
MPRNARVPFADPQLERRFREQEALIRTLSSASEHDSAERPQHERPRAASVAPDGGCPTLVAARETDDTSQMSGLWEELQELKKLVSLAQSQKPADSKPPARAEEAPRAPEPAADTARAAEAERLAVENARLREKVHALSADVERLGRARRLAEASYAKALEKTVEKDARLMALTGELQREREKSAALETRARESEQALAELIQVIDALDAAVADAPAATRANRP